LGPLSDRRNGKGQKRMDEDRKGKGRNRE